MDNNDKKWQLYKKEYYEENRETNENKKNSGNRWTPEEVLLLFGSSDPDKDLAKYLGRSLQALHVKRATVMKRS